MSIASPTLIPRPPVVPLVLPKPPHIGPTPLPGADQYQGRINHVRDLQREADDLSDEENDLEDCVRAIITPSMAFFTLPEHRIYTFVTAASYGTFQ